MPRDAADSLNQAGKLSISDRRQTFKNAIGDGDSSDFVRIQLKHRSHLKLTLKGLQENADLELIHDRNRDGDVDLGDLVASSRATGTKNDSINLVGLEKGTYYVRVFSDADDTSKYQLTRSAKRVQQADFAYDVVKRTNAFRADNDLAPLAVNTQLTKAAKRYAKHMAIEDNFSHTGADGSSPWDRIRDADYDFSDAAENLAGGHKTPDEVVKGWIGSPGHRANMLAYQVEEIGVGYYNYPSDGGKFTFGHYWAQVMGTWDDGTSIEVPDDPTAHPDD